MQSAPTAARDVIMAVWFGKGEKNEGFFAALQNDSLGLRLRQRQTQGHGKGKHQRPKATATARRNHYERRRARSDTARTEKAKRMRDSSLRLMRFEPMVRVAPHIPSQTSSSSKNSSYARPPRVTTDSRKARARSRRATSGEHPKYARLAASG
jgi:hypothetical protein